MTLVLDAAGVLAQLEVLALQALPPSAALPDLDHDDRDAAAVHRRVRATLAAAPPPASASTYAACAPSAPDPVAEQLHTQSPLNYGSALAIPARGSVLILQTQRRAPRGAAAVAQGNWPRPVLHFFEPNEGFEFAPAPCPEASSPAVRPAAAPAAALGFRNVAGARGRPQPPPPPPRRLSVLTRAVRERLAAEAAQSAAAKPVAPPQPEIVVKLFFPNKAFVEVPVPGNETVQEVTKRAVALFESHASREGIGKAAFPSAPEAYLLRAAEDDGRVDDDIPDLVPTQPIGQYKGILTYVIVLDPKFSESEPEPERPRIFKVLFPNDADARGRMGLPAGLHSLSILFNPETTLGELLALVVRKKELGAADAFAFEAADGSSGVLPMSMRMQELEDQSAVRICAAAAPPAAAGMSSAAARRSPGPQRLLGMAAAPASAEEGDGPPPIAKRLGALFFFTPVTAACFQQFRVAPSGSKAGPKGEEMLGIDKERVTWFGPKGVVRNSRPTREVFRASATPNRPGHFELHFKDKKYEYESLTNQAEYICQKIAACRSLPP